MATGNFGMGGGGNYVFEPESTLTNPNTAPSMKTLTSHMGNYYAQQLRPVGRATVVAQGSDNTTILLSPNGGCAAPDGNNYPLLIGFDTQQMSDSFGLGISGSPYEMVGDTGNNTMTFSLSPGNQTTLGFRAANPRHLPYLSGVTPGAALGVKLYGMYDFVDPQGVTHTAIGTPDPIVSKPELNVLVDDKTIGINVKNELYALPGAGGAYAPGQAIIFLPGSPPTEPPVPTAGTSGTGPGGSVSYALAYITTNGTTPLGPASGIVSGVYPVAISIGSIPPSDGNATGQILYRSPDGGTTWGAIQTFSGTGAQTLTDSGTPLGAAPSTTPTTINVELAKHAGNNISGLLEDAGDDANGLAILLNYRPSPALTSSGSSSGMDAYEGVGSGLRIDPDTATNQYGLGVNLIRPTGGSGVSGGSPDATHRSALTIVGGDDGNSLGVLVDGTTVLINNQNKLTAVAGSGTTYQAGSAIKLDATTTPNTIDVLYDNTTVTLNGLGQLQVIDTDVTGGGGSGGGSTSTPYSTQVTFPHNSGVSLSNAADAQVVIPWSTISVDNTNGQMWTAAYPTRLTAPVDGVYHATAQLQITFNSPAGTETTIFCQINRNGDLNNSIAEGSIGTDSGFNINLRSPCDSLVSLKAGDYVEVYGIVDQANLRPVAFGSPDSWFGLSLVSSGVTTLAGNTDVSITGASPDQLLQFSTAGLWQNVSGLDGGIWT